MAEITRDNEINGLDSAYLEDLKNEYDKEKN